MTVQEVARERPTKSEGNPSLKWVCLSDTHFGAENSLLSAVDPHGIVDPTQPSPTLISLVDCLRALIEPQLAAGVDPPTLILNGDALEFALAADNVAAMVFDRFIELAFGAAGRLFAPTILYVPGNHDHHIWETAREQLYAAYVAETDPKEVLGEPWHATRLFAERGGDSLQSELLTALVRRQAGNDVNVRIIYPNLGLESATSDQRVLLHHGH